MNHTLNKQKLNKANKTAKCFFFLQKMHFYKKTLNKSPAKYTSRVIVQCLQRWPKPGLDALLKLEEQGVLPISPPGWKSWIHWEPEKRLANSHWPGSESVGNVAGRPTDPLTELNTGCEISNPHDKQSHREFTAACKTGGDLLRETSWITWGLRCGLRNNSRS